ncbi:MAG: tryptophan synthase subunit alpha [Terriglobia bacterium]
MAVVTNTEARSGSRRPYGRGARPAGRLGARFAALRQRGELTLVAYVTVGDPTLTFTEKLVLRLAEAGADVIELGVPFSDPIADGPVIQRASERALRRGTTLTEVLALAARLRSQNEVPLVLFSYYNPVLQLGRERFAAEVAAAGVDAVLITDLTPEEAGDYLAVVWRRKLATVFLAAPTSSPARLKRIAEVSRGFVYVIARRGVTGARADVPEDLPGLVGRLRRYTKLPLAVGFGISQPEQVRALARLADGVVVGSALVECCERHGHSEEALAAAAALVQELKGAAK